MMIGRLILYKFIFIDRQFLLLSDEGPIFKGCASYRAIIKVFFSFSRREFVILCPHILYWCVFSHRKILNCPCARLSSIFFMKSIDCQLKCYILVPFLKIWIWIELNYFILWYLFTRRMQCVGIRYRDVARRFSKIQNLKPEEVVKKMSGEMARQSGYFEYGNTYL